MSAEERMAERRARRAAYLRSLYEAVDASVSVFVNGYELASGAGIDRADAGRIIAYLEEKGMVRVDDHREGTLRITAAGIDAVEEAQL